MILKRLDLIYNLLLTINQKQSNDPNYILTQYFLEHFTELSQLNIHEVAADCYVSRSTVRRFCQQIGYENFKDLKEEFREFKYQYTYFTKLAKRDNFREYLTSELDAMLKELNERMNTEEIDKIAQRIHDSKNVVFLSSYSSVLFLVEFQRPLVLSGKLVKIMTDTNMDVDFLNSLEPDDFIVMVSATGNFATTNKDILKNVKAYKTLITTARKSEIELEYDKVYHLSANDYSDVKSVYSKYGMEYFFDILYSTYLRKYGMIIKED